MSGLMRYAVVWFMVAVGCSQPTATPTRQLPNPDDTPDVEATGPILFKYDREARRARYEPRKAGPWYLSPCNPNRFRASPSDNSFMYPKGPDDMAALVLHAKRSEDGTQLFLDRGQHDGVDTTWSGVLLDDRGHALHDWTCVRMGWNGNAILVIQLPLYEAQRFKHVALFQEPPPISTPR